MSPHQSTLRVRLKRLSGLALSFFSIMLDLSARHLDRAHFMTLRVPCLRRKFFMTPYRKRQDRSHSSHGRGHDHSQLRRAYDRFVHLPCRSLFQAFWKKCLKISDRNKSASSSSGCATSTNLLGANSTRLFAHYVSSTPSRCQGLGSSP